MNYTRFISERRLAKKQIMRPIRGRGASTAFSPPPLNWPLPITSQVQPSEQKKPIMSRYPTCRPPVCAQLLQWCAYFGLWYNAYLIDQRHTGSKIGAGFRVFSLIYLVGDHLCGDMSHYVLLLIGYSFSRRWALTPNRWLVYANSRKSRWSEQFVTWFLCLRALHRVAPKSNRLPNYQWNVLKHADEIRVFFINWKCQTNTIILSLYIRPTYILCMP